MVSVHLNFSSIKSIFPPVTIIINLKTIPTLFDKIFIGLFHCLLFKGSSEDFSINLFIPGKISKQLFIIIITAMIVRIYAAGTFALLSK